MTRQATERPAHEAAKKCTFLIPLAVIWQLRASAERNRRAVYAELVVILEQHFAASEQQKREVA